MNKARKRAVLAAGFTLLEILVSLLILGIISVAFIKVFSSTLEATNQINDKNELLHEAQIAQQVIASRVKVAWEVFPPGTSIYLNNGKTTKNYLGGSHTWIVGKDPILAMILPPKKPGHTELCDSSHRRYCFRFYAYFAYRRSDYLAAVSATSADALPPDSMNDDTWVIMEFRKTLTNIQDPNDILPPSSGDYPGVRARLLVEYVQPETESPTYTLFTIRPDKSVDISLRMIRHEGKRDTRAPGASEPPLTIRAVPRNLGVGN